MRLKAHPLFLISQMDPFDFLVRAARGFLWALIALPEVSFSKTEARVEEVQRQNTGRNNGALQANEVSLRLHQIAAPALAKLSNTVHTASEDAQRSEGQRDDEAAELDAGAQFGVRGIEGASRTEGTDAPPRADSKVAANQDKDKQRGALHAEPRQHDVVARLRVLALVRGRRCHAAAQRLQYQREEVARDEDLRVALRLQPRVLGSECSHDPRQAEVQACGVEGWRDGQTHDLNQEAVLDTLLV